jgi:hypothetical protein
MNSWLNTCAAVSIADASLVRGGAHLEHLPSGEVGHGG